ncbi:hypothetical protein RJT34_03855 [Clitoria ternatea]|uniref:Uncharacterized protein n=1 Tax=Clitoria ternatea TaxID=43366 RepID=A0AAN9KN00_CLITE
MNWVQRKIYLYNVTFGLYMLDWWERCAFNTLVIVLMWFVLRYVAEFFKRKILTLVVTWGFKIVAAGEFGIAHWGISCRSLIWTEMEHLEAAK